MLMQKLRLFSPVILRIGLAIMFIWFGINQFTHTSAWVAYIPQSLTTIFSLSAVTFVHLNGIFEIIFGTALLLGFFTRFSAFLLAIHLLDITFIVGLDSIGMRDLGLTIATFAVWLNGHDFLTLDRFMGKGVEEYPYQN